LYRLDLTESDITVEVKASPYNNAKQLLQLLVYDQKFSFLFLYSHILIKYLIVDQQLQKWFCIVARTLFDFPGRSFLKYPYQMLQVCVKLQLVK